VVEQTQTLHIINEPEISIHSAPGSPRRFFFLTTAAAADVCLFNRETTMVYAHTHTRHSGARGLLCPSLCLSRSSLSISPLDHSSLHYPSHSLSLSLFPYIYTHAHKWGILAPVYMCPRVRTPTHPHTDPHPHTHTHTYINTHTHT